MTANATPAQRGGGGIATTIGLCCGAIGVLVAWLPFLTLTTWLLGPAAIIGGLLGVSRESRSVRRRGWVSVSLGALSLVIAALWPYIYLPSNGTQ